MDLIIFFNLLNPLHLFIDSLCCSYFEVPLEFVDTLISIL